MKNLIFILLASIFLISCNKSIEDVRKVKKGISVNELKYIMGEPKNIEINPGNETWTFYYDGGARRLNGLVTIIKDEKVVDFYSY